MSNTKVKEYYRLKYLEYKNKYIQAKQANEPDIIDFPFVTKGSTIKEKENDKKLYYRKINAIKEMIRILRRIYYFTPESNKSAMLERLLKLNSIKELKEIFNDAKTYSNINLVQNDLQTIENFCKPKLYGIQEMCKLNEKIIKGNYKIRVDGIVQDPPAI